MIARICFLTLLATPVLGQTVESSPAFEVASVKLNDGGPRYFNAGVSQIVIRNHTLRILIYMAYGVGDSSFSGPNWLDSINVDIVAKLPSSAADLSPKDRALMTNLMLQRLLSDRFKLKVHREEKVIHGYALVVAPGGLKMRRAEAPVRRTAVSKGSVTGDSVPIGQIKAAATSAVDRPVRDMTGLDGNYQVDLKFTPDADLLSGAVNGSSPDLGDRPPSIFTALQEQLGLKLEPRELPIEVIVVDHVEETPIEN